MTNLKKNVWYALPRVPPARTERLGSLSLLILNGERIQEGYYSHEEDRYYVHAQRYAVPPNITLGEIVLSVDQINKALEWEDEEAHDATQWMLIDRPVNM